MCEIIPGRLWLGSLADANNRFFLKEKKIVSLAPGFVSETEVRYYEFAIEDNFHANIETHFKACFARIDEAGDTSVSDDGDCLHGIFFLEGSL